MNIFILNLLYFLCIIIWMRNFEVSILIIENLVSLYLELIIIFTILVSLSFIKKKFIKNLLIGIFIFIYGSIFVAQVINIQMIGDYINLVTLNNANQIDVILNTELILKTILLFFSFTVISIYVIKNNTYINKKRVIIFISFVMLFVINIYINNQNKFMPIKEFTNLIFTSINHKNENITSLNVKDLKIAKEFNIYINPINKTFQKENLYKQELPFLKTNNTEPNIIIFFIESLSARLLGPYKEDMKEVTPNINDFANYSTVVNGYYNHSTPTAPGLYGQNCSIYPLLTYNEMDKTPNILKLSKIKCMASYAKEDGYNTIYFSHSRGHYTHLDQNFKIWGYDKVVMWRDFTKKFLNTDNLILGEAGPSDHQMMEGLVNFLKNNKSEKKFFLGLSTIESHIGRKTNEVDGIKYKNGANETLNLIHNLDDAFYDFWTYFKKSRYFNNTIVILTGDHTLYPNKDFKQIAGDDWIASVYDNLSLIIYDPVHKLPKEYNANSTSIDLAPTIMHLLNINKKRINSFLGNSIFDKKEYNNSFGISGYQDFNIYINIDGNISNKKPIEIKDENVKSIYNSLSHILKYSKYLRMKD